MSTFGGDSWVPENLYRKRRVAELLGEEIEADEVRLLSNGGLACLVCPNGPVLDTVPMLHIHRKGSRHQAAAEHLRGKKQRLHAEIQKRMATGSGAVPTTASCSISTPASGGLGKKVSPLLMATKNIKDSVLLGQVGCHTEGNSSSLNGEVEQYVSKRNGGFFQRQRESVASSAADIVRRPADAPQSLPEKAQIMGSSYTKPKGCLVVKSISSQKRKNPGRPVVKLENDVAMQELRRVTQLELKWKEAGWRRDAAGRWSRDENVEFDSDEEVPVDDVEMSQTNISSFRLLV